MQNTGLLLVLPDLPNISKRIFGCYAGAARIKPVLTECAEMRRRQSSQHDASPFLFLPEVHFDYTLVLCVLQAGFMLPGRLIQLLFRVANTHFLSMHGHGGLEDQCAAIKNGIVQCCFLSVSFCFTPCRAKPCIPEQGETRQIAF